MHRRFFEGKGSHINAEDLSDNYLQFALSQSNQAIQDLVGKQGLRAMTTRADKVTLMTCSILFFSMSCLQGYQKDAFEHLRSGIRMLNEIDGTDNDMAEDHPVDVESLRSIFVGLDLQARSIMPRSQARRWVSRPKTKATEVLPLPELSMSSILAVLRFLESLYNQIHAFFQSASSRPAEDANDIYLEYSDLITRFHRGTALLETLCEKSSPNTDEFTEPLVALRLQQSAMEYLLRNPRPDMGAKFSFISRFASENDLFNEPFDASAHVVKMFELATRLLPISSTLTPVFTMGIGPLSVLWLVAMRAPSTCALLRKRAISLMLSHPRREGFWDGMLAGRIAQEALRLEQESAQEELGLSGSPNPDLTVPDELRIAIVGITYVEDNDRKAKIQYINARDVKAGRPGSVQWINW
ncbi:Nn.00g076790.m01.CDS01 [Neocucurbitaria sp. VM-36]